MGVKVEITWKTRDAQGARREINARKAGAIWRFFEREKRFDRWDPIDHVPLEHWLRLLEAVQRRIARRLLRPEEETNLRRRIAELYPDADT
jgi:hypothetical protein